MNKEAEEKIKSYNDIEKYLVGQLSMIRSLKDMLINRLQKKSEASSKT